MGYITLGEYAEKYGRSRSVVRTAILKGKIKSAIKPCRDWLIDEDEPMYEDRRITTGEYKDWRKKLSTYQGSSKEKETEE